MERHHDLLHGMKPRRRTVLPSDVRKVIIGEGEQQDWSASLDQEDQQDQEDPEPPHIKEELEEADITKFPFTPVKSEDDEEEPQPSQLHQRQTEHVEPEAAGEDCGGPGPHRDSDPGPDTDDSNDWKETREPQSGLNEEVPVCDAEKPFSCSECGKRFGIKRSMKRHMIIHTGEKPFSCSECGKPFRTRGNLKVHVRSHTGEKPFSCSFCKKSYTQSADLQRHMSIHTGEKRFSCSGCDQRFTWLFELRNHKCVGRQSSPLHQTQSEQLDADGEDCGGPEAARNSGPGGHLQPQLGLSSLNNDEAAVGAEEKPFSCSICGKMFGRRTHLNRHMSCHTGEKPFSCSICGKGFPRNDILARHMRFHSGEKPFSCSFCLKGFTRSDHVATHMRRTHFLCDGAP